MTLQSYVDVFPKVAAAMRYVRQAETIQKAVKEANSISRADLKNRIPEIYSENIIKYLVKAGVIKEEVRAEEWISKPKEFFGKGFNFQFRDNKLYVTSNSNYKTTVLEDASIETHETFIVVKGDIKFQVKRKYYTWMGY